MIETKEKYDDNNIANLDEDKLHKRKIAKIISSSIFLGLSIIATILSIMFFTGLLDVLNTDNAAGIIFGSLFLIIFWIISLAFVLAFGITTLAISLNFKGTLSIIYIILSSLELIWAIGSFVYFISTH